MSTSASLIVLTTLLLAAVTPTPTTPTLLVINQGDATISIINAATTHMEASLPESVPGQVGHEVAISPDGRLAYIPLYGNSGVGRPGTDGQLLLVVDLAAHKIVNRLDFGHGVRPHCAVFDRTRNLLYVTAELDQAIAVINPATLTIVATIPTGQPQSHMLTLSHDGRRGYTANVGPGTVSVLDMAAHRLITTIPIAATTQRISISNDDARVFTADQTRPQLAVIDTATNRVEHWIPLPAIGYGTAPTPDGRYLLVALPSIDQVAIVDLKTLTVTQTVKTGPHPQEVLVRPDGKLAYVSNFGGNQVSVIAIPAWQLLPPIAAGLHADGLAFTN